MSLTDFKPHFDNAYEEIFQKTLVSKKVMNTRFEAVLKFGETIERVAYDISNVRVRTVTRGNASTIDPITDSSSLLTVNLEKEAVFHISDGEVTQAGPLNPGETIGKQVGHKVSIDLDARAFAEVLNAANNFDNGDLTTLTSSGTPITLSSTTVPQLVSRLAAKLRYKEQIEISTNMVLVIDSYGGSDVTQYLLGKNIDLAGSVFKNGYSGDVGNASMFISENLTGTAVLSLVTQPTANDTITINGVVFTFVASPSAAGDVDLGADVDATRVNLTALINDPTTTTSGGVALSTANQILLEDTLKLVATDSPSGNTMTIVGTGSGRLIVAKSLTDGTDDWTKNYLNCYYGKRGAIDLVIQDMSPVDMRKTSDRRGTNVFSSYLAGLKTFTDGSKKFLNLLINA